MADSETAATPQEPTLFEYKILAVEKTFHDRFILKFGRADATPITSDSYDITARLETNFKPVMQMLEIENIQDAVDKSFQLDSKLESPRGIHAKLLHQAQIAHPRPNDRYSYDYGEYAHALAHMRIPHSLEMGEQGAGRCSGME